MNSRLEGMENPKCCVCAPAEHDDAIIGIGEKSSLNSKVSISAPHSKAVWIGVWKSFLCTDSLLLLSLGFPSQQKICEILRLCSP